MTSLQKLHLCSNQFHALPYTQLSELAFKHALHWLSIQQNYLDLRCGRVRVLSLLRPVARPRACVARDSILTRVRVRVLLLRRISEMHDFLEQMERSQCRVSYCHQHIPQVVWKDPSGNSSAAIYLGGVHSAGTTPSLPLPPPTVAFVSTLISFFVLRSSHLLRFRSSSFFFAPPPGSWACAENVKWLEVNRIINVLSVGEFPFKSEKIGVKRPKRTKTDDQEAAESGAPPNDENDDDEVIDGDDGSNNNEDDEEAKREAKKEASVKSLTRRIYPPHFKVPPPTPHLAAVAGPVRLTPSCGMLLWGVEC
jgi:hypothetical protein